MFEINPWYFFMLFFGFWWGSFVTTFFFKRIHRRFINEIHAQYRISLKKMETRCRRECDGYFESKELIKGQAT